MSWRRHTRGILDRKSPREGRPHRSDAARRAESGRSPAGTSRTLLSEANAVSFVERGERLRLRIQVMTGAPPERSGAKCNPEGCAARTSSSHSNRAAMRSCWGSSS
jgi:hypothetical protein